MQLHSWRIHDTSTTRDTVFFALSECRQWRNLCFLSEEGVVTRLIHVAHHNASDQLTHEGSTHCGHVCHLSNDNKVITEGTPLTSHNKNIFLNLCSRRILNVGFRSEERRVGRECWSEAGPCDWMTGWETRW